MFRQRHFLHPSWNIYRWYFLFKLGNKNFRTVKTKSFSWLHKVITHSVHLHVIHTCLRQINQVMIRAIIAHIKELGPDLMLVEGMIKPEWCLQRRRQEKTLFMCLPRCVLPFPLLPSAVCLYAWCGKSGIKPIPYFAVLCLVPSNSGKCPSYLSSVTMDHFYSVSPNSWLPLGPFNLLSVCEYFVRIEMWQWNRGWSGLCVSCSVYWAKKATDVPWAFKSHKTGFSFCFIGLYQCFVAYFYLLFRKWKYLSECEYKRH